MIYELIAYNTDCRYDDVRYRRYTSSEKEAKLFEQIPKIQFTDSGHGIVFSSRLHSGHRNPTVSSLWDYVSKHMSSLKKVAKKVNYTDKELLNYLQKKLGSYSGKAICRWSVMGRGWRLHETSKDDGVPNVREAITAFIKQEEKNHA